ncbi:hypothetical protein AB0J83_41470 [Actinoplanes sp. NPDC049596]|uniref:hypothetical protein n=1 Tax=unclassified Actinoplanes TaxID=2626549 RepID=UPI00343FA977
MSLMDKRDEVVAALEGIEEVKPFPVRQKLLQFGDTWVVQGSVVIDPPSGLFEDNWFVVSFLGQDELRAAQWMSDHWQQIVTAVETVAVVDRVDMVDIGTKNETQFTMQITARSE